MKSVAKLLLFTLTHLPLFSENYSFSTKTHFLFAFFGKKDVPLHKFSFDEAQRGHPQYGAAC